MSHRNIAVFVSIVLLTATMGHDAEARGVRVDSGSWDLSGFLTADSNQNLGFDFEFFGFTASSALISTNGSATLSDGTTAATLAPLFDPGLANARYEVATTNASFNQAGIDAGFRVTWQVFEDSGFTTLLNEFQLALWDLAGGLFAFEFNYNGINAASVLAEIGFATSDGGLFDLPGALGFSFADFRGNGDSTAFSSSCPDATAFACNNFFFNTMQFGPDITVLPDIANDYFRRTDPNDDGAVGTVQGRFLFLSEAVVQVPEPSSLALLALGLFALAFVQLRARRAVRTR